jgi:hypothetical protein
MKKDTINLLEEYLLQGLDGHDPYTKQMEFIRETTKHYIKNRVEEFRKSHTFPCGNCSEPHEVILENGEKVFVTCL